MERLRAQFPAIAAGRPESESTDALIESILDVPQGCADRAKRARIEVFLTSMGVWEVEHLIIERTGAPSAFRYRREHREIIPDQSLRLLLPRAVLRRALALKHAEVAVGELERAESSMIYPIDEPVVEPALRGLLRNGWPTDGRDLAAFIRTVMGRRTGALRT